MPYTPCHLLSGTRLRRSTGLGVICMGHLVLMSPAGCFSGPLPRSALSAPCPGHSESLHLSQIVIASVPKSASVMFQLLLEEGVETWDGGEWVFGGRHWCTGSPTCLAVGDEKACPSPCAGSHFRPLTVLLGTRFFTVLPCCSPHAPVLPSGRFSEIASALHSIPVPPAPQGGVPGGILPPSPQLSML